MIFSPLFIIIGIILFIVLLLLIFALTAYNNLVKRRNRIEAQWAQIDVQLARRADLIPNMVETVKGFASHEKELLENVTAARSSLGSAATPAEKMSANDALSQSMMRLFAVAEAYPALKSNTNFLDLQANLKECENKIAYARQFYNDAVLLYRDLVHQFPTVIIANMCGFKDESHYVIPEEKKGDVKVSF